ncbi:hypothetical protein IAU59_005899 [Kwoniella sp. CBS 9459]
MPDKLDPKSYKATKNEVGVFTTPDYSDGIKPLWKFKNAEEAEKSAKAIWTRFEGYKEQGDFVGMDICRKFIQMGRTRSLRYALRKGGRKYDPSTGEEQERTGKVYDQGKLDGANIYEKWLDRCWANEEYSRAWDAWKEGRDVLATQRGDGSKEKGKGKAASISGSDDAKEAGDQSQPKISTASESEDDPGDAKKTRTRLSIKGKRRKGDTVSHGDGSGEEERPVKRRSIKAGSRR